MDVVGGAPRSSIVEQSDREIKSDNRREIMREKKTIKQEIWSFTEGARNDRLDRCNGCKDEGSSARRRFSFVNRDAAGATSASPRLSRVGTKQRGKKNSIPSVAISRK